MLNITINPILAVWGPFSLTWHGLFQAAGALVVYYGFLRNGRRRGLPRQALTEAAMWVALAAFAGARLLAVAMNWRSYVAGPARILAVSGGGITVLGGLIGGILAALLYARRARLPAGSLLDACALALPLGSLVGRVGCIIMGDVWGPPTGAGWGLVYFQPQTTIPGELLGVPTFPLPILYQLLNLAIWLFLLRLNALASFKGNLFVVYLLAYGAGRLFLDQWRSGISLLPGLNAYQGATILLIALGMALWFAFRPRPAGAPPGGVSQPPRGRV